MDIQTASVPSPAPSPKSNILKRTQPGQISASCTLCRRRKVKCDREFPCGSCTRAGVECVPLVPSRVPRGRKGGRKRRIDGELLERIAKLEALIEDAGGDIKGDMGGDSNKHGMSPLRMDYKSTVGVTETPSRANVSDIHDLSKGSSNGPASHKGQSSPGFHRYLGASFWVTLSDEVNGLKEVLDDSSNEEDELEEAQTLPSSLSASGRQQLPLATDSSFVISRANFVENPGHPTARQLYSLCEIFLKNVDPVFKILHAPSLRRYLQDGAAELDCSPGPRGLEALKFAISYAATVSLTDEECRHRIGEDRVVLLARYRAGTEQALAKADFVNTVEMSTLQAMILYLASFRVNDPRRFMWTLTSLAVRIAQAMGLHHESPSSSRQPFRREMRRRLWWQICILDSHAAGDRATNPLIYADSFSTKLPLNINDEDLHVDLSAEIEERQGFTDMTFCLICQEITDTVRRLDYIPVKEFGQPQIPSQERWNQRIDAVISVQRRIEERYLRHLNLAHPFHWGIRLVADMITAITWLVVYRPLQQRPDISFSQFADPGILGLSVEVLEKAYQLYTDPAASSFRWLSRTYVQWHALAVTIAELCVQTEGPVVERAWAILMPVFKEASQHVADSDQGMLWRPVKKLMNRAQELRRNYLDSRSARNDLTMGMPDWNAPNQGSHRVGNGGPTFDMMEAVQGVAQGAQLPLEGLPLVPSVPGSAPFDWDPWLAAASMAMETPMQSRQYNDMNQVAWTNWENFVSDFQEQDEVVISGSNGCE